MRGKKDFIETTESTEPIANSDYILIHQRKVSTRELEMGSPRAKAIESSHCYSVWFSVTHFVVPVKRLMLHLRPNLLRHPNKYLLDVLHQMAR